MATAISSTSWDQPAVVGTVALDGKPEFAATDRRGRILVNIEDRGLVQVFDARSLEVAARWPLAPGEEPTGLALDEDDGVVGLRRGGRPGSR